MVGTHDRDGKPIVRKLDLIDSMIAVERRQGQRRGARRDGALGLPDLRLVLGHVHRQQHELPERGARAGAARQRHAAGDARAPLGAVRGRRPAHRRDGQAPLRRRRRRRAPAQHRHLRGVRERDDARHRDGRVDQHRAAHPGDRARGGREVHDGGHRSAVAQGARTSARSRRRRSYHVEDVHRAGGIFTILGELDRAGLIHRERRHRARADDGRGDRPATTSAARRRPPRRKQRALAAPGGVPTKVAFSQDKYFADADNDVAKGCIRDIRARLQQGRRAGRALRQHRRRRLHREDGGRRRIDLEVRRARRACSTRRTPRATPSSPTRSSRATSS